MMNSISPREKNRLGCDDGWKGSTVRLPLLKYPGKGIETAEESDAGVFHEGACQVWGYTDTEPGLA